MERLYEGAISRAATVIRDAISVYLGMVLLGGGVFWVDLSFCMPWGYVNSMGVWNDTLLCIIWLLMVVTALRRVEDALFGTLNSNITSQSKAAYENNILGLVESWNT